MASIPGTRFDITGTTGSQGALTPKSGWRAYVFPRGAFASQDSTGTLITFDSASVASRFAANDWIQAGLATANIRLVAAVGGNSLSVSGAALTVAENDRIFVIGTTEPTVTGGSATYNTPATIVRQRDDDGADLYTNSMITSNSDGLIQFFGGPAYFDVLIQDGNRANQGYIADLPVGAVEGISTSSPSLFGATVTINGAFGITGWATFGQSVTMNAALGVTGWATFGSTVTMHAALGVTGVATLSGIAAFGNSVSVDGALGVTGTITGSSLTLTRLLTGTSATFSNDLNARRLESTASVGLTSSNFVLSAGWGTGSSVLQPGGWTHTDTRGLVSVTSGTTAFSANPTVVMTFAGGPFPGIPVPMVCIGPTTTGSTGIPWSVTGTSSTAIFRWHGTPDVSLIYQLAYHIIG